MGYSVGSLEGTPPAVITSAQMMRPRMVTILIAENQNST